MKKKIIFLVLMIFLMTSNIIFADGTAVLNEMEKKLLAQLESGAESASSSINFDSEGYVISSSSSQTKNGILTTSTRKGGKITRTVEDLTLSGKIKSWLKSTDPTDWSNAYSTGMTWGTLSKDLGLWKEDPNEDVMAIADAFDPDEMAKLACKEQKDLLTEGASSTLTTETGEMALTLEASFTNYDTYITCDNSDGSDNDTVCVDYFNATHPGINTCDEGLCICTGTDAQCGTYGYDEPLKFTQILHIVESIFEPSGEFWESNEKDKTIDLHFEIDNVKITSVGDLSYSKGDDGFSYTGTSSIMTYEKTQQLEVCIVFDKITYALQQRLEELVGGSESERFCTDFDNSNDNGDEAKNEDNPLFMRDLFGAFGLFS